MKMKAKTILIFMSGILAILIPVAGWWYLHDMKKSVPAEAERMAEEMPDQGSMTQAAVMVSPTRQQLIGVKTDTVEEHSLETIIRTVGTVDYDERRVRQVNLRISGWLTKLFVDSTGRFVKKGDPLFTLYSPDLVSTQEEYLLARRTLERVRLSVVEHISTGAEAQVASARNRLLLWGLTDEQIGKLEVAGRPQVETTIYSPFDDGVVIKKTALQGMYVTPEMNLYEIADLSVVWIYADIYEYEVPLVQVGQDLTITLTSYPGEEFHGRVIYIYPYLNTETRTVKVRMEFPNSDGKLKPGMYANVDIWGRIGKKLAISQEAVLDSGTRKLVFVDKGEGRYEPREVKLGNKINHLYPVIEGLSPGEKVVTSATFLIDSESKLMAATSMMGLLGMGGIKMEQGRMGEMDGEMDMGGMKGMKGMEMAQVPGPMEQTVDGLTLTLTTMPKPPKKGENIIHLSIKSKEGPVTDAKVAISYTMVMPGMGSETVEARHTKDGTYEARVDLGMKGGWNIDVLIEQGKAKPIRANFTIQAGK